MNVARHLIACLSVLLTASAEVFICRDTADVVWFTDRPCPGAVVHALSDPIVVATPPITPVERRVLRAIAARKTAPVVTPAGHSRSKRLHSCTQAQQGLEAVRDERRRGYPLVRAAELDDLERRLRAERDRWC